MIRLTVLVAGAAGYIGGRLTQTLVSAGKTVRAAGLKPGPNGGDGQIVVDFAGEFARVREACRGATSIVHLAGANEVVAARDPGGALAGTVRATFQLAQAALEVGAQRVVYLSTVHVYGAQMREGAVLEEEVRPEPRSPYAIARLASEHTLAAFADKGLEVVVLRLTNSVGAPAHPNVNRWTLVTNDLCRQGAVKGELNLNTSGVQWRDFIALSVVCQTIVAASEGSIPPGVYNLGSGNSITIRDVAALVQDAFERQTGRRPPLHAPDPPPQRPKPYTVSVERLRRVDAPPATALATAVDETVAFCLYHRDRLAEAFGNQ